MTTWVDEISIPCAGCGEAVRFGDLVCPACALAVPAAARVSLERRLEAASPEFGSLRRNVVFASTTLIVIAVAYLTFGVLVYHATVGDMAHTDQVASAQFDLLTNLAVAVVMAGCFVWSRRAPTHALVAAAVLWATIQVVAIALAGVAARDGLAKLATLGVLVWGVVCAFEAARLRARLLARAALPVARLRR